MKALLVVLLVIGLGAGGAAYYVTRASTDAPTVYRTAAVKRGDLLATIGATGTVEPEEVVDVGAQVAGRIEMFGRDPRDRGQDDRLRLRRPGRHRAWPRSTTPSTRPRSIRPRRRCNRAKADLLQLRGQVRAGGAGMEAGRESAARRRPSPTPITTWPWPTTRWPRPTWPWARRPSSRARPRCELAKTNLDYTIIKSPVEGVIIDRRVNIGQTVVASLNAPSLFLIAKDLRRMQVWASVNEADIGRIRVGHAGAVHRRRLSGRGRSSGKVAQIRLNATMTQNVVTYTVVVVDRQLRRQAAALPDGEPAVRGRAAHRRAAWCPTRRCGGSRGRQQIAPEPRDAARPTGRGRTGSQRRRSPKSRPPMRDKAAKPAKERDERGRLWVEDGDFVRPDRRADRPDRRAR